MSVHPSGPARVEENQSQRSVVAQARPEDGEADPVGAAVSVLEVDDIVLDQGVEVAVPAHVKDVDLVAAQPLCQRREGRGRQPVELYLAEFHLRLQPVLDLSPLGVPVERAQLGRRRDQNNDLEGSRHREWRGGRGTST